MNLIQIHTEVLKNDSRHTFPFSDQSKEKVLRSYIIMLKADRFFSRHRKNFPNSVGKVVIHNLSAPLGSPIVLNPFGGARNISIVSQNGTH